MSERLANLLNQFILKHGIFLALSFVTRFGEVKSMSKIVKEPFAPNRRNIKNKSRVGLQRMLFTLLSLIFLKAQS
jgi:hypothetical protein